ncbi:MAG: hypothetical protein KBA75_03175 [Alphaproteobacteria bacterium]|nr:hypothetical protein [Alphaproteobacteria bacterium]
MSIKQSQVSSAPLPSLQNLLAPARVERQAQRAIRDYLYAAQRLPWRLTHVPQEFHPAEKQRVAGFADAAAQCLQTLEKTTPERALVMLARIGVRRGKSALFELVA